jgi:VIT1/CCC1 family predicted Fe2+/Mn2+ transporter
MIPIKHKLNLNNLEKFKNEGDDLTNIANKQLQKEINEHFIYNKLSKLEKNLENKKILEKISKDELKHYLLWKKELNKEAKPQKLKIFYYIFLAKIFGLSFSLKLMEDGEEGAKKVYKLLSKKYEIAKEIEKDEVNHERDLIRILKDERLNYASSIVLGLNDALVELTGTLAGLSFAFSNSITIGITGLIMGVAASLSMAASGYLSSKENDDLSEKVNPIKSAIYTGVAYIITVFILVLPYFLFENVNYALFTMLISTLLIIAGYNYFISVAREVKFKPRFLSMATISLVVALISYIIGILLKFKFGI